MRAQNSLPSWDGQILPLQPAHRAFLRQLWTARWGGDFVVSRGQVHHIDHLPGFLAVATGDPPDCTPGPPSILGALTYQILGAECEVVTLDSLAEGRGVGSALLAAARQAAEAAGCRRLWLVTTNDNLPALRFYQRRGFRLAAVHAGAVNQTRRLKPSIPLVGIAGIPLRDEIELELPLLPPPSINGYAQSPIPGLPPVPPPFPAVPAAHVAPTLPGDSLTHTASSDPASTTAPDTSPNCAGTRLSRRPIYESRWVNLYLDHMRTPSGHEITSYHVIDYPNPAVAMYITNDRGEVLLGHYPRYVVGQVRWEVPAGGVEPGEDLLAAAAREVYEETGYTIHAPQHYYTYHPTAGSTTKVFHLVRAQVGARTGALDPHEVEQIRWFAVDELKAMIARGEIQDGYTLTALLLAWQL